jgi:hypothetical protein
LILCNVIGRLEKYGKYLQIRKIMNIYLAKMIGQNGYEGDTFYDLVKADTPQEARYKVEKAYGYGYDIEINVPIE